jgi:hypothetical protein
MTTRLAIVDLDGVVADNDARFARARANGDGRKGAEGPVDWSIAFDPDLVSLDGLIMGADQAVKSLEQRCTIIYLTSRPESIREATQTWLALMGKDSS